MRDNKNKYLFYNRFLGDWAFIKRSILMINGPRLSNGTLPIPGCVDLAPSVTDQRLQLPRVVKNK